MEASVMMKTKYYSEKTFETARMFGLACSETIEYCRNNIFSFMKHLPVCIA